MVSSRRVVANVFLLSLGIGSSLRQTPPNGGFENAQPRTDMLSGDFNPDALLETAAGANLSSPSYTIDMARLKKNGYQEMFCGLSSDGCRTLDGYPGPGIHNELTHEEVEKQMQLVPDLQKKGKIWRGNELGYLMLSPKLWDNDFKTIGLGLSVEDHEWVRPLFDAVIGHDAEGDEPGKVWSAAKIAASLEQFFNGRTTLLSSSDVAGWATILQHEYHFDMHLDEALAQDFLAFQGKAVPASLDLPSIIQAVVGVDKAQKHRDEWLERYKKAISDDTRGLLTKAKEGDDHHKLLLASAFMDSLLFAGGLSVPGIILTGIALVHAENSPMKEELTEENAVQFAYEVLRLYPGVVGFPWWSADRKKHIAMNIATALRDPRAWGEDSLEFKLRPLDTYKKLARVAWAEPANGPKAYQVENPGRTGNLVEMSRGCPGQALSMTMMTEFFKAWAKLKDQFGVVDAPKGGIAFEDATPFASTITLAKVLKKSTAEKLSYSRLSDVFGSGYSTTQETFVLFAGDASRAAELHYSKDGAFSIDDPSKREVAKLTEGSHAELYPGSKFDQAEGVSCVEVTTPDHGDHFFCADSEIAAGWHKAIAASIA